MPPTTPEQRMPRNLALPTPELTQLITAVQSMAIGSRIVIERPHGWDTDPTTTPQVVIKIEGTTYIFPFVLTPWSYNAGASQTREVTQLMQILGLFVRDGQALLFTDARDTEEQKLVYLCQHLLEGTALRRSTQTLELGEWSQLILEIVATN